MNKKIFNIFLDLLFPINCLSCDKEGFWICERCLDRIKLRIDQACPVCEKVLTPDGRTCLDCKRNSPLDGMVVACSYQDKLISRAIHTFKYRFIPDLHAPLAELLIKAFYKTEIPIPDIIIPVPLHDKRLRWRGFNQSMLLAEYFSSNLLPTNPVRLEKNLIARTRYTTPQMKIKNLSSRKNNILDAFKVIGSESLTGKSVLIIDDVSTTGSTIFECAQVLKNAGAKEVFAVVLARQEFKKA